MKGLRLYLFGSLALIVMYLLAQYFKPKPTDWKPSYEKEDKIPFGLYILHQEHESIFPGSRIEISRLPAYNTLKDHDYKQTNYLIVAGGLNIDKLDFEELQKFMDKGNHVFIAAYEIGNYLQHTLKLRINSSLNYGDKSTPVNFVNPSLKTKRGYEFEKDLGDVYFSKVDTSKAIVLGRNQAGEVNFVKYKFGKGALFVLPNPKIFTNYNLLNPEGAAYAAKALSYLPAGGTLIWDEYNTKGNIDEGSELRVFFRHSELRWAYYLSIFGLLIFVLFEIKRRQRIIPVIEPLKNTSVDFAKVVGRVYYQQRDNRDLAGKKINYFLEFVRTNYRLKTTVINEELVSLLVLKSGASEDTVRPLFEVIKDIGDRKQVNDAHLINLNKLIEKFYKQAQ